MRLHVIGHKGVVGGATYELFKRLGYDVTGSDREEIIPGADVYFVCVPEDSVEGVVKSLRQGQLMPTDLIVVRSSVSPGTCKRLSLQPLSEMIHICHNPEFLREATAVQDEFNPDRIVIGQCCEPHGRLLKSIYRPLRVPIVLTDPTTSELVKLASNCYLATVISYWNEIEKLAQRLGVSGHQVGMTVSMDPRISPYGARLHNKYGGRCLPKDMKQVIALAERLEVYAPLLRSVEEVNNFLVKEDT